LHWRHLAPPWSDSAAAGAAAGTGNCWPRLRRAPLSPLRPVCLRL